MLSEQKVKMQIYPNFIQEKVCKHMYFLNPLLVYNGKKRLKEKSPNITNSI